MASRLREYFKSDVQKTMMDKFKYNNIHKVPRLSKITISCVNREAVQNGKIVEKIAAEITTLAGQKAVVVRAKKSVASFKLREGMAMGAMVTLRGDRMFDFFDRLVNLSLPRVRDFRGVSPKAFDGKGNYTLGVKEQIMFPEIDYDKIDKIRGMGIVITTSADNNEEGRELLKQMGMPFRS